MRKTIQFIHETLSPLYEPSEIESFKRLIFNSFFGYSAKEMILNANQIISNADSQRIEKIISRLRNAEPIQYILGVTEFYGLAFNVEPGVLIPRFETEELVDLIVKRKKNAGIKIIDIGTGSGCIAVSLKKFLPESEVWGCDVSDKALEISKQNAALNNVEIKLEKFDVLGFLSFMEGDFDLIVSNPPYVTNNEKKLMQENVLNYEPAGALFVPDDDPLLFYREIALKSEQLLKPGGELYFEINEAYGKEVSAMLVEKGFTAEVYKDINGKDRMVFAHRLG